MSLMQTSTSTPATPTSASILPGSISSARSKKPARLRGHLWCEAAIEQRLPLKIEIHRIGIGRLFGPPRLGGDQLGVKLVGEPRHDLVLHVKEVGQRLVGTLGP